jgi:hypothetical protein
MIETQGRCSRACTHKPNTEQHDRERECTRIHECAHMTRTCMHIYVRYHAHTEGGVTHTMPSSATTMRASIRDVSALPTQKSTMRNDTRSTFHNIGANAPPVDTYLPCETSKFDECAHTQFCVCVCARACACVGVCVVMGVRVCVRKLRCGGQRVSQRMRMCGESAREMIMFGGGAE